MQKKNFKIKYVKITMQTQEKKRNNYNGEWYNAFIQFYESYTAVYKGKAIKW